MVNWKFNREFWKSQVLPEFLGKMNKLWSSTVLKMGWITLFQNFTNDFCIIYKNWACVPFASSVGVKKNNWLYSFLYAETKSSIDHIFPTSCHNSMYSQSINHWCFQKNWRKYTDFCHKITHRKKFTLKNQLIYSYFENGALIRSLICSFL